MESTSITSALTISLGTFARRWSLIGAMLVAGVICSSALLAGCEEKGPAEQAGEDLDKAAKKAGDAIEDAGDKIKDATR